MSDPIEVTCGQCDGAGKYDVEPSVHLFSACVEEKHDWCVGTLYQREAGIVTAIHVCRCACHQTDG